MAVGVRWIALAEVVAQVEREEACRLALQLGRHRDRIGVYGEMDERASPERDVLRVAVVAVLLDRVLDVLAGEVVLELRRCDRDAVEEQAQVERLVRVGVEWQLARDRQAVGVVIGHQLRSDTECGLAVGELDLDVLIANAMPQDIDGPALVDLLGESVNEPLSGERVLTAVSRDQLFPLRPLCLFDEGEQLKGVETERGVELLSRLWLGSDLAGAIAAVRNEMGGDLVLEQFLADRAHDGLLDIELAGDGCGDESLAALLEERQLAVECETHSPEILLLATEFVEVSVMTLCRCEWHGYTIERPDVESRNGRASYTTANIVLSRRCFKCIHKPFRADALTRGDPRDILRYVGTR